jgi:hypothetical protein
MLFLIPCSRSIYLQHLTSLRCLCHAPAALSRWHAATAKAFVTLLLSTARPQCVAIPPPFNPPPLPSLLKTLHHSPNREVPASWQPALPMTLNPKTMACTMGTSTPHDAPAAFIITEINRIQSVLFGPQNRRTGPYLGPTNRVALPVILWDGEGILMLLPTSLALAPLGFIHSTPDHMTYKSRCSQPGSRWRWRRYSFCKESVTRAWTSSSCSAVGAATWRTHRLPARSAPPAPQANNSMLSQGRVLISHWCVQYYHTVSQAGSELAAPASPKPMKIHLVLFGSH